MIRQLVRFSLIGMAATLVHLLVGITLIHAGWPPLIANVAAFGTAFLVSFAGHFGYTFSSESTSVAASLVRFIVVALLGFAANEAILAGLLTRHILSPTATLIVSTGFVALGTFILCRRWAFVAPRGSCRKSRTGPYSRS